MMHTLFGVSSASAAAPPSSSGGEPAQYDYDALFSAVRSGDPQGIMRKAGEQTCYLSAFFQMATVSKDLFDLLVLAFDINDAISGTPVRTFFEHYCSLQKGEKDVDALSLDYTLLEIQTLTNGVFGKKDAQQDLSEFHLDLCGRTGFGVTFTRDIEQKGASIQTRNEVLTSVLLSPDEGFENQVDSFFKTSQFKELPPEIMFLPTRGIESSKVSQEPYPMPQTARLSLIDDTPTGDGYAVIQDYECIAFVVAAGEDIKNRHFYICKKGPDDRWYEINDGEVMHITDEDALQRRNNAYQLLYVQKPSGNVMDPALAAKTAFNPSELRAALKKVEEDEASTESDREREVLSSKEDSATESDGESEPLPPKEKSEGSWWWPFS